MTSHSHSTVNQLQQLHGTEAESPDAGTLQEPEEQNSL